ncbi:MAG: squalene/phytoene synthase family protein [Devosia sp.]|nr:squalene/phytoene synthase family protein [Devosia sp.]
MNPASAALAAAILRELDRERYLASLVLPEDARPAVTALYAFSAEVAAIRERAHGPMPGEIRLQWWRDALTGQGHGEVRQNPVADVLLGALERFALPAAPLLQLLEARRFDLYHDPMPDLPTFEGYAGETVSVLHQLAAMVLNGGRAMETGDAAGHLGVAQALTGHLRAFGYNAAHGRIFLPWSVFAANGVVETEVFSGISGEGLIVARRQLVDLAGVHLGEALKAVAALPRHVRPAFASAALLPAQLQQIAATAGEPFAAPADIADWRKIALLCWRTWLG